MTDRYVQYHLNNAISNQRSAALHYSGAREFMRGGLLSTAQLWQELGAFHSKIARREILLAEVSAVEGAHMDLLYDRLNNETSYYMGADPL